MPPTLTVVYETAEVITHDNEQKFQLIGSCTDEGDLFDKHLFLLTIIDGNDATSDTYKRLCTIADSVEYKKSRDAAVQAGDTYWRSNSFMVLLDDVDVAAAAKTALNDRIDLLATGYATYIARFKDPGSEYKFPTGTTIALAELVEAYYDAWKIYDAAKRDSTEADTEVARATTVFTNAETRMNDLLVWEARLLTLRGEMGAAHADFGVFVGQGQDIIDTIQTFLVAYDAGASAATKGALAGDIITLTTARADYMNNKEAAELNVTAAGNGLTNHFAQQGLMGNASSGLIGDYVTYRDTTQLALTNATSDKLVKNQDAADKLLLLTDAYDEVRAVQSDWIPDAWFPYPP